jgi:hypothetical protein
MQVDMRRTLDLSLESAKEELADRGMLYYKSGAGDGPGLQGKANVGEQGIGEQMRAAF